jgi:hypothetical protein
MPAPLALQPFLDAHPPGAGVERPSRELVERYRARLPASLLELWQASGLGPYAGGLIHLVDPARYEPALYGWLQYPTPDPGRVPIALSAFGVLFYYRRLGAEGEEDVAFVDPHTSATDVLAWSLEAFFNECLCDQEVITSILEAGLFEQARLVKGPLGRDQTYHFVPALRVGGRRAVESIDRGDAAVHLELLLQLALGGDAP